VNAPLQRLYARILDHAILDGTKFLKEPKNPPQSEEVAVASALDITGETCPMTFVRVRLALDRLPPGGLLEVLLKGDEPRRNVPRTAAEQGHQVLSQAEAPGGALRVTIRRKG
jgi:TusA-related sulfurtransferase